MTDDPTISELSELRVYDFFCPAATQSRSPDKEEQIADLCSDADIKTVGQLVSMKPSELRAQSFPDDLIPYICLQLQRAHPALNLTPDFVGAVGAQGRAPAISALPLNGWVTNGLKYGF